MERELTVASALNAECFDDLQRSGSEHLILFVGKRYCRSDNDTVAGVNADGVKVLHRADRDDVARLVADDFELDLLPAGYALFDKDLCDGRKRKTVTGYLVKFVRSIGDTAARASERERRTNDYRITDLFCEIER